MNRENRKIILCAFIIACIGALLSVPFFAGAGSLEPPPEAMDTGGNPHPTMRPLDELPPPWDSKIFPISKRFKTVGILGGVGAVLDKETGLVWERMPSAQMMDHPTAQQYCYNLEQGPWSFKVKGWHLPTAEQLASLLDVLVDDDIKLPSGHPFSITLPSVYYGHCTSSRSSYQGPYPSFFAVELDTGEVRIRGQTGGCVPWCVRGGQSSAY